MKSSSKFRFLLPHTLAASVLALAAWAQPACAQQVVYSTNFDDPTVYPAATSLSGDESWTTNDLFTGASYNPGNGAREIGQSDDVLNSGFASSGTDNQALLGGALNVSGGAVPGHPTVYLYRPFGLAGAATMQFNADYVVTAPGTTVGTAHDSFGFTFQSTTANLFSINFVPTTGIGGNPVNSTTADDVSVTTGTTTAAPIASFSLGSRYHLTVNVNIAGGTFSASLTPQNNTGGNNGATVNIATNVPFTGAITDIAATWVLANQTGTAATTAGGTNSTAYAGAGTNSLLFDNYAVTIPEPSTYALLGLGAAGLVLGLRRRQAQA